MSFEATMGNESSQTAYNDYMNHIGSYQSNYTEFESIIEVHEGEMTKFIDDNNKYSASELRSKLTKEVLTSIPFPYETNKVRHMQNELIKWLNVHKSLQTNDINLLRQRIANYFILKVHEIPHVQHESIEDLARRQYEITKANQGGC